MAPLEAVPLLHSSLAKLLQPTAGWLKLPSQLPKPLVLALQQSSAWGGVLADQQAQLAFFRPLLLQVVLWLEPC